MTHEPADHPSVSPYLVVPDAPAALDFLTATFGAETILRHERDDGSVQHASLRVGDSVVMLGQALEGWPPTPAHVHVYVADVDATYATALENGATSVQSPAQRDDPDRRGGVKGPGGITWWIATRVG